MSMIINPFVFADTDEQRVEITISAQPENFTSFPVYIDLSTMPAEFWSNRPHNDGRDVRVKDSGGADIPFHLVRFDIGAAGGSLFARVTLSSGGPTSFFVHWGNAALAAVPNTDANGAFAVWADYHRVFLFNILQTDFAGSGNPASRQNRIKLFEKIGEHTGMTEHQGLCWDGTHYYVTDTNEINKYDASWGLVASNSDPVGDVGNGTNHCGDPDIHDGILYVPVENYTNITTFSNQRIARFDASDLTFIDSVDVSAQGDEVASIAIDAEAGFVYTSRYSDEAVRFQKYHLGSLAWIEAVSGDASIFRLQGLTRWRGKWFANSDTTDTTYRVTDAIDQGVMSWTDIADADTTRTGNYEGIGKRDDDLIVLRDDGGSSVVHIIRPLSTEAGGGVETINGGAGVGHLVASSVTDYSVFTLGVTVIPDAVAGVNQAAISYTASQTANTNRVTIGYRAATGKFGIWDTGNSWLDATTGPVAATKYRLHGRYDGTTSRALFVDGAKEATVSGITAAPAAKVTLSLGAEDLSLNEPFDGRLGFVYLRPTALSDAWIAAECSNLSDPGTFYSVGAAEDV